MAGGGASGSAWRRSSPDVGSTLPGGGIGGRCTDDGGLPVDSGLSAYGVTSGTFTSPDIDAIVCGRTERSPTWSRRRDTVRRRTSSVLSIDNTFYGAQTDRFQFQEPADAVAGELTIFIEIEGATPGSYTNSNTCGEIVISALLPIPSFGELLRRRGDGLGLSTRLRSGRADPRAELHAASHRDRLPGEHGLRLPGRDRRPAAIWTLTLTSVAAPTSVVERAAPTIHGTLSAKLARRQPRMRVATGSLSVALEPAILSRQLLTGTVSGSDPAAPLD